MTKAQEIKALFLENYKDAKTELIYNNLYELLISVMLSAQCTDKRVNIITPALFQVYPDVDTLAGAKLDDVKSYIKTCSFFNNKAVNLIKMATSVRDNFNSNIPLDQKGLVSLAGVGQKTANVVLIEYAEANLMAVDTHVTRVAKRLGLSREKTPEKIEAELTRKFKTELATLHQAMVLFGRYKCKAVRPICKDCYMYDFCNEKLKTKFIM
ncbi:MAG: Endonuclease III (EC [uncultured Campylobacterales bacterium]|uniref:Endonuclease III n=1 Tax=uncultured Campylobacterales bacterium TaxID=352960 RepID=A0A6S6T9C1_9BACT|nr:MAG: Endonuclease III (EC [uncultured Campylobacterales bacterium]